MKRICTLIILFFVLELIGFTQTIPYRNLKVKERFDDIYTSIYDDFFYRRITDLSFHNNTSPTPDYYVPDAMGSYWCGTLDGLLDMYEVTRDKAYLYKFIYPALEFQYLRGTANNTDAMGSNWYSYQMYHTGRAIWFMSHFVYVVYNDDDLYNTDLVDFGNTSTNIYHNLSYYTSGLNKFGDVADYFNTLVNSTLDDADTYWIGGGYDPSWGYESDASVHEFFDSDHNEPEQLNKQAPWACALTYSFLASRTSHGGGQITDYGVKAAALASLYFGSNMNSSRDVLIDEEIDISSPCCGYNYYHWDHNGWRIGENGPEDIGHGIDDIMFPLLYNKYRYSFYPTNITAADYFNDDEMCKFRNTFVYQLYTESNNLFHNLVDGSDNCTREGDFEPNFDMAQAMGWMPLFSWDNSANAYIGKPVYDINMDFFREVINSKTTSSDYICYAYKPHSEFPSEPNPHDGPFEFNDNEYFASVNMKGLANIASAQWEKECYNLTLKNRDLVYDQDFYAKNTLTIDPASANDYNTSNPNSFADPVISTEDFIIEDGVTSEISAGHLVIIKPGFHAKPGSAFRSFIDTDKPSECSGVYRMAAPGSGGNTTKNSTRKRDESNDLSKKEENRKNKKKDNGSGAIKVYPNPGHGVFNIFCRENSGDSSVRWLITVVNLLGETVYSAEQVPASDGEETGIRNEIDLSAQRPGIYFVSVQSGGKVYTQKLVKE